MKYFSIVFRDGKTEIKSSNSIEDLYVYYSYQEDCGNYLLDPDIQTIEDVTEDILCELEGCDQYNKHICHFIGFEAPSHIDTCKGKDKDICKICPCNKINIED